MDTSKIKEGIIENLVFDTLIDYNTDTYKIECIQSAATLDLTITNRDNESEFTVAYVSIGKVKDKELYMIKINHKKDFWYKEYPSLGRMVDNIDEMISFIKDCCKIIIKGM